ncbi:hypothetical protein [Marinobacter zhejiangensis]|uniref:Uncharacterized protein n=1 Tax=Marinobacter zhejiangensis TaxID=488535 RepID=A0A1I4NRY6_9GAMM|nr:hypothetical protein [Marinobacter zhejiangensis]SFM18155.1 hypothetical protein SAMN04487963_1573 [Marinobacter zhejiangensis]
MIQDSLKNGLESVQATRKRLEDQVRPTLDWATAELKKVLADMGADVSEPTTLSHVVAQVRKKNPSLKALARQLDVATYDLRKKLWWDANMMTAYVSEQAGKTYEAEVKPKIQEARDRAESQARRAVEQLRGLTQQLQSGADKADANAE